tara:strand:- start:309 stop:548 length:240 start_codon:yes stop_codon:yes gene_type:complete
LIALKKIAELYIKVLSSPDGKEMMKEMYRTYGKRLSFDPHSDRKTSFNEGQRSVYLRMMHLSKLNPNEIETEAEKLTDD